MGFLGLKRAEWKHPDEQVRARAVERLRSQETLHEIVQKDQSSKVRQIAARNITRQDLLEQLLTNKDSGVAQAAAEALSGQASEVARRRPLDRCRIVFETIREPTALCELALKADHPDVRQAAAERFFAIDSLSDGLLETIAIQDESGELAPRAVERIAKRSSLKGVAKRAKTVAVRDRAHERIAELENEAAKPSLERQRKALVARLDPLVKDLKRQALASDPEQAAATIDELQSDWRRCWEGHDDLAEADGIADLVRQWQQALQRFEQHRADTRQLRETWQAFLDADSADERWANTATACAAWTAMDGDGGPWHDRFTSELQRRFPSRAAEEDADPVVETRSDAIAMPQLSEEDRAVAERLIADAEALADGDLAPESNDRFMLLHKEWSTRTAGLPPDHDLRRGFMDAYGRFKERRRERREQRQKVQEQRQAEMEALIGEAEALDRGSAGLDGDALREVSRQLKDIQAKWKAVGPVRANIAAPLRQRFRAVCDTIYARLRSLHEEEDWARFANAQRAEELIAEARGLSEVEEPPRILDGVKAVQKAWRANGPLPRDRYEALRDEFRAVCDEQFDRCKPWFAERDAERQANLERKRALVEEVEALTRSDVVGLPGSQAMRESDQKVADRIKAIQREWREVGPVPREHDRDLFRRFRSLCDEFFTQRKAAFAERDAAQADNLAAKEELCARIESLGEEARQAKERSASDQSLFNRRVQEQFHQRVRELQRGWRDIGHVPRADKDTIWARFRSACDAVYDQLDELLAEREAERQENLAAKRALLDELSDICANDRPDWFRDDVRSIQDRWREIGPVPREALDELEGRYRELCSLVYQAAERATEE